MEKRGEFGLLIVNYQQLDNNACLVNIEKVIPINENFRLQIGDIYLKLTYGASKLIFELRPGPKTDSFINELKKGYEALAKKPDLPSEFHWLDKYFAMANVPEHHQVAIDMFDPLKVATPIEESVKLPGDGDELKQNSDTQEIRKRIKDSPSQDSLNSIPRDSIAVGDSHLAARESIVWLQMNSRRNEYTDICNFRIFIGTWNVNGQSPTVSLTNWLACDEEPPDIYAIGFQELDLSKEAYVFYDSPREGEWLCAVRNGLHTAAEYEQVKLIRLVGMMLIIFIQKRYVDCLTYVAAETVGTGIMGKLGNKGGVAVRLEFHNTSICFVNSHLAAHPEEYERRNQDYQDICTRMGFQALIPPKAIKDHDQVYWFGDLNYRIDNMSAVDVRTALNERRYKDIFLNDQLKYQQTKNRVFKGYEEGAITFHPTYKYNLNSDDWDMGRTPAWCDRILWKGSNIRQIVYRSHSSLKISDHKPVSAIFESGVMVVNQSKQRQVYEETMKQLDKLENEFLPQVTVDKLEINFNAVKFIEAQRRYLTLANTGQVPVRFEFIKKPNEEHYCKEWLTIKPFYAIIMPGETCDVELEVLVDKRTAYGLNIQKDKINDILVLHLEGGKDFFITVTGQYQPTCFGMPLDALVYIRRPISELKPEDLVTLGANAKAVAALESGDNEPYDIPKEVWLLVDHLSRHGLEQDQLFEQPGLPSENMQIRDCLDTCMPTTIPGSINSVAETLLIFLEALPEPVIPYKLYYQSLEASQNFSRCQQIVRQLPMVHQTLFKYLMAFLKALLFHTGRNKLDAKTLSTLFGGILLRPPPDKSDQNGKANSQATERKKANFIYHFLNNEMM